MQVLYFANIRETLGKSEETLSPPSHITTINQLLDWLATQDGNYEHVFNNREHLRAALNQEFVAFNEPLEFTGELALFPPVTGG